MDPLLLWLKRLYEQAKTVALRKHFRVYEDIKFYIFKFPLSQHKILALGNSPFSNVLIIAIGYVNTLEYCIVPLKTVKYLQNLPLASP